MYANDYKGGNDLHTILRAGEMGGMWERKKEGGWYSPVSMETGISILLF